MMVTLTEEQLELYKDTFNIFDGKGDGKISVKQVGDLLRSLGQNPTESEINTCCEQFKPEDRIGFEVFLPIYQTIVKNKKNDTPDDFIEGLRHFDNDASGVICSAEFRQLLTGLGEKLTEDEVDQLLIGQEDDDGNINYEEFVKMVLNG